MRTNGAVPPVALPAYQLGARLGGLSVIEVALTALIAVGLCLRVFAFAQDASLWFDEAMLARNVIEQDFWQLFGPLPHYAQAAPIGFLVVSKLIGASAGYSEEALRLFPLVAGIAAPLLLFWAIRPLVPLRMALLAAAFIALSPAAIRYSVEFKQYSIELAVSALTLLLWRQLLQARMLTLGRGALLAMAGALAVTMSFTVIVIMFAAGVVVLVYCIAEGSPPWSRAWWPRFLVLGLWAIAFVIVHIGIHQPAVAAQFKDYDFYFDNGLVGSRSSFVAATRWFTWRLLDNMNYFLTTIPGKLTPDRELLSWAAIVIAVLGAVALWCCSTALASLVIAVGLTLAVLAGIGVFPILVGRYNLFLVPIIAIVIGGGAEAWRLLPRLSPQPLNRAFKMAAVLPSLLLVGTVGIFGTSLARHPAIQDVRPLLALVDNAAERLPLVLFYGVQPAFEYYTRDHPRDHVELRGPRTDASRYLEIRVDWERSMEELSIAMSAYPQAWLLVTNELPHEMVSLMRVVKEYGTLELFAQAPGAHLYLFTRHDELGTVSSLQDHSGESLAKPAP